MDTLRELVLVPAGPGVCALRGLGSAPVERFRSSVRERRGRSDESLLELPDLELAKSLGVVEANGTVRGVKLAALLLFGQEDTLFRHVPTHEVAFQAMRALDVEINDFFRWPLLRVTKEIEVRIRARNREQELLVARLNNRARGYRKLRC